MSDTRSFCPRCGAPIADGIEAASGRSRGPLCRECYFEDFELVDIPDALTVGVCPTCGAIDLGDGWTDGDNTDLTDVAIEAVQNALRIHRRAEDPAWRVQPEHRDANTIAMHTLVTATVRGHPRETSVTVPVTIDRTTCDRCSRIAGQYWASLIQVRATDRPLTQAEKAGARSIASATVEAMTDAGDRQAFVTDVAEVDDGLDIKVSTTKLGQKIARRVVDRFGGHSDSSETLVTTDADGNDVYRVTYAVRLPAYVPGDIVDPEDGEGPVLIAGADDRIRGRRLRTGEPYTAPLDATDAVRIASASAATETALVAVEDEHAVQIIDPATAEAITVSRPAYLDPNAETVPAVATTRGTFVLPEDHPP